MHCVHVCVGVHKYVCINVCIYAYVHRYVCVYECFIESDSEVKGVGYPALRNEQKERSSLTQGILQRVLECGRPLPSTKRSLIPREQVKHIGSDIPETMHVMQPDGAAKNPGAWCVHTQTSGRHLADARGSWEKTWAPEPNPRKGRTPTEQQEVAPLRELAAWGTVTQRAVSESDVSVCSATPQSTHGPPSRAHCRL